MNVAAPALKRRATALTLLALAGLAACDGPTRSEGTERISLSPGALTLVQYDTASLTATYFAAAGDSSPARVSWAVADTMVAVVDAGTGLLRARRAGATNVVARSVDNPRLTASARVTVGAHPLILSMDSVVLGPSMCAAAVEASVPSLGNPSFRWTFADWSVAGLELPRGGTEGMLARRATLKAAAEGRTTLTVQSSPAPAGVPPREIVVRVGALPPDTVDWEGAHRLAGLIVGDTATVRPVVLSACGTRLNGSAALQMADPTVATVAAAGRVTAVRVGTNVLTGRFGAAAGDRAFLVADLLLLPGDTTVREGDTLTVRGHYVTPSGTREIAPILSTTDTAVAAVLNPMDPALGRRVVARRAGTVGFLIGRHPRGRITVVPR